MIMNHGAMTDLNAVWAWIRSSPASGPLSERSGPDQGWKRLVCTVPPRQPNTLCPFGRGILPKLPADRVPDDGRRPALLNHHHAAKGHHRGVAAPTVRMGDFTNVPSGSPIEVGGEVTGAFAAGGAKIEQNVEVTKAALATLKLEPCRRRARHARFLGHSPAQSQWRRPACSTRGTPRPLWRAPILSWPARGPRRCV